MSSEGCTFQSSLSSGDSEQIIVIISTRMLENFSQSVLCDIFSGKEDAGNQ